MESTTTEEQANVPVTEHEEPKLDLGDESEPLENQTTEEPKPTAQAETTPEENKTVENTNETADEPLEATSKEQEPLDLGEDDTEQPNQNDQITPENNQKDQELEELDLGDENVVDGEQPEQSESNATSQPQTIENAQSDDLNLGDDLELEEPKPAPEQPPTSADATADQPPENDELDLGDDEADDVMAVDTPAATDAAEQTNPEENTPQEIKLDEENVEKMLETETEANAEGEAAAEATPAADDDGDVQMTSAPTEGQDAQEAAIEIDLDKDVTMGEAKDEDDEEPDNDIAQLDKELEALIDDKSDAGSEISFSSDSGVEVSNAEIYGDDDDYEEPATTKRSRLRKRKASANTEEERPAKKGRVEEENLSPEKQAAKDFEELTKRTRPKSVTDIGDAEIAKICSDMCGRMEDACHADRECVQQGELAINKLALLPRVEHFLQKTGSETWQELMTQHGILRRLSDWLAPLPDKSLPNLKVRTVILKALRGFGEESIDKASLTNSGLGRFVNMLARHPKETKDNRKLAASLVRKWSKLIFNINSSYRGAYSEGSGFVADPQNAATAPGLRRGSKMVKISPHHASIPEKSAFDYTRAPKSKTDIKGRSRNTKRASQSRLASMGITGKKSKESTRHVTMSINK